MNTAARNGLLVCCIGSLVAGCARVNINVGITSYLSRERPFPSPGPNATVGVVAATPSDEPLFEAEVRRKVEILLLERGYPVTPVRDADYVLFVFFAIDEGNTETGARPVYTPGGTATTHLRTSRGGWATATTNLPGSVQYVPYSYTYFVRHLSMTLYERTGWIMPDEKQREASAVWRAVSNSAGSSSDLRGVMDYLLVATFDKYGQDTGKRVRKTVWEGDDRVTALRKAADFRQPAS